MTIAQTARLLCHPTTQATPLLGIEVGISRPASGSLVLTFRAEGGLARVRWPPPRPPRVVHQLWEHTCFEAFIAAADEPAYHELNFAPSGEWAGYAFRSYREVTGLADEALAPRIEVRRAGDRLELDASVALDRLARSYARAPLRLGLSAVIEDQEGALSYWSLRHPAGRPDFHHADALALRLEPPPGEW